MQNGKIKDFVNDYLEAWRNCSYMIMAVKTQKTWHEDGHPGSLPSDWIEREYRNRRIASWKIKNAIMLTDCNCSVRCDVMDLKGKNHKLDIRVLCEKAPYKPSKDGVWGVNPVSAIRDWIL